uniref:Ubiquitin-like 4B n=1 Tax=Nothobranchius korthausae TaxID=1143690 RepID=A0A1A8GAZ0_9TELE
MIITVKPLSGLECNIQVSENDKVSSVKELLFEQLKIPVNRQRLLYKGRLLADDHKLRHYSIGPDAKLHLIARPLVDWSGVPSSSSSSSSCSPQAGVWQTVSTILARHFSPADAAKVYEQLMKDYERSLRQLSLDDIERLAGRLLHPDGEGVDTSYMD